MRTGNVEIMKTLQPATRDTPAVRVQARLGAVLSELFGRWPALLGFAVQEEGELHVAELTVHPWLDQQQCPELGADIAVVLHELIEEEPAAHELLNGRTFARVLH